MSAIPLIPSSTNLEEMREIITRICREYLTGAWKTITADDIQLKRISGGLSNFLYYVSLPETTSDIASDTSATTTASTIASTTTMSLMSRKRKRQRNDSYNNCLPEPKEVLLRIYGQTHGEQALETVLTDTVVFTLLSERKLGPKLHGIFPGGRIEQYIPARALQTIELSDAKISQNIAKKMAEIHSLNIPVCKEPEWLWKTMERWLMNIEQNFMKITKSTANKKCTSNRKVENDPELSNIQYMEKFNLRNEMNWLRKIVEMEDDNFPVVFSHNDLQEGNILLKESIYKKRNCTDSMYGLNESSISSTFSAIDGDGNDTVNSHHHHHHHQNTFSSTKIDTNNNDHDISIDKTNNNDTIELDSDYDSIMISNGHFNNKINGNLKTNLLHTHHHQNDQSKTRKRSFDENDNEYNMNEDTCSNDSNLSAMTSLTSYSNTSSSLLIKNNENDDLAEIVNSLENTIDDDVDIAEEEPELMIIDFEYCAYNYRGFDFANHFLEWTMDYTNTEFPYFYHKPNQYPTIEQQTLFIRMYLKQLQSTVDFLIADADDYEYDDEDVNDILNEIKYFTMISHFFWTLWSLVNVHQDIKFGYWEYAKCRVQEYFAAKEDYHKYKGMHYLKHKNQQQQQQQQQRE